MADEDTIDTLPENPPPGAPEAPEAPEPIAQEPEASPSVRAYFDKVGIPASQSFQSDEEFVQTAARALQIARDNERYVQFGQAVAPVWDQFQQWQSSQQKPAEPEPAPEAPAFEWKVPEVNQEWYRLCNVDPNTGRYIPRDPAYMAVATKLNDYEDWQRGTVQKILKDFPTLVESVAEKKLSAYQKSIEERIAQEVEAGVLRYHAAVQNQRYIDERYKEFYQVDANGQPVIGANGQAVLTPKGRAATFYAQEGAQLFSQLPENERLMRTQQYVDRMIRADDALGVFGKPQQQQPSQSPRPVDKRQRFLDRVRNGHAPNRSGSIPDDTAPPTESQNRRLRMSEISTEEMRKNGWQLPV